MNWRAGGCIGNFPTAPALFLLVVALSIANYGWADERPAAGRPVCLMKCAVIWRDIAGCGREFSSKLTK